MPELIGGMLSRFTMIDALAYLMVAGLMLFFFPRSTVAAVVAILGVGMALGIGVSALVTRVLAGML